MIYFLDSDKLNINYFESNNKYWEKDNLDKTTYYIRVKINILSRKN